MTFIYEIWRYTALHNHDNPVYCKLPSYQKQISIQLNKWLSEFLFRPVVPFLSDPEFYNSTSPDVYEQYFTLINKVCWQTSGLWKIFQLFFNSLTIFYWQFPKRIPVQLTGSCEKTKLDYSIFNVTFYRLMTLKVRHAVWIVRSRAKCLQNTLRKMTSKISIRIRTQQEFYRMDMMTYPEKLHVYCSIIILVGTRMYTLTNLVWFKLWIGPLVFGLHAGS